MNGTNFFTGTASGSNPAFTDSTGNAMLVAGASAGAVTGAGYAIGCLFIDTTSGKLLINTGSATSVTWTVVGSQS